MRFVRTYTPSSISLSSPWPPQEPAACHRHGLPGPPPPSWLTVGWSLSLPQGQQVWACTGSWTVHPIWWRGTASSSWFPHVEGLFSPPPLPSRQQRIESKSKPFTLSLTWFFCSQFNWGPSIHLFFNDLGIYHWPVSYKDLSMTYLIINWGPLHHY